MSCHSTRIELFYFDDKFCRIAQWVRPFSQVTFSITCISKYNNLVVKGVMRFEGTRSAITMVPGIVFSVSGFVIVAYISFTAIPYLLISMGKINVESFETIMDVLHCCSYTSTNIGE